MQNLDIGTPSLMLIGLVGPFCAGKKTVAHLLRDHLGFSILGIGPNGSDDVQWFDDALSLIKYMTPKWREHAVVYTIPNERTLHTLMQLFD
jgi:ABC-type uncharacterized transport system ATPase subunit